MSVLCCILEPLVGSHSAAQFTALLVETVCKMAVPNAVVVPADTRNAVHDEMAAQGSLDDYLHIVVSITRPFCFAHLSFCTSQ